MNDFLTKSIPYGIVNTNISSDKNVVNYDISILSSFIISNLNRSSNILFITVILCCISLLSNYFSLSLLYYKILSILSKSSLLNIVSKPSIKYMNSDHLLLIIYVLAL